VEGLDERLNAVLSCVERRIGDFTAILTGSRARGDARPLGSDVDIIIVADRTDPLLGLCCTGLPIDCDLIQVETWRVGRLLDSLITALIEGLLIGRVLRRGGNWPIIEQEWRRFLEMHEVVYRDGYLVVRGSSQPPRPV